MLALGVRRPTPSPCTDRTTRDARDRARALPRPRRSASWRRTIAHGLVPWRTPSAMERATRPTDHLAHAIRCATSWNVGCARRTLDAALHRGPARRKSASLSEPPAPRREEYFAMENG